MVKVVNNPDRKTTALFIDYCPHSQWTTHTTITMYTVITWAKKVISFFGSSFPNISHWEDSELVLWIVSGIMSTPASSRSMLIIASPDPSSTSRIFSGSLARVQNIQSVRLLIFFSWARFQQWTGQCRISLFVVRHRKRFLPETHPTNLLLYIRADFEALFPQPWKYLQSNWPRTIFEIGRDLRVFEHGSHVGLIRL